MALATFKDLCLDAVDPARLGAFWASALHLELQPEGPGQVAHLTGVDPAQTVWLARVPEPKTVKHRVHLDLNVSSVEDLTRAGATVLDADSFPWTLLADPEGGELCAFVREGEITAPLYEVVVDCADSAQACHDLAVWWGDVLGGTVGEPDPDGSEVEAIPGAPFEYLVFGRVPEPKTVKNRIHLDVTTPDLDALLAAGAVVLRAQDDEIGWTVLADLAGNEFCAFVEG
jgi:hypothetical protein